VEVSEEGRPAAHHVIVEEHGWKFVPGEHGRHSLKPRFELAAAARSSQHPRDPAVILGNLWATAGRKGDTCGMLLIFNDLQGAFSKVHVK
jgi:hypothetical protein